MNLWQKPTQQQKELKQLQTALKAAIKLLNRGENTVARDRLQAVLDGTQKQNTVRRVR